MSVQTYARVAGILVLISIVAGGFGEFFVPSQLIVSTDAAATAHNIMASDSLLRWGFAAYLVEATCDVALTLLLYVLLRPAGNELALLAAFFRVVATATFVIAELLYFSAAVILGGSDYLKAFSPEQLNALAFLAVKLNGYGGGLAEVFYGAGYIILGYLIVRSGYLPRWLGVLLALSGVGFVARSFALVLAPAVPSSALLLPTAVAGLALMLWLLVKGVDVPAWEMKAALAASRSIPT